jgi:hypothetical protein
MISLIVALFPALLKFVGGGVLSSWVQTKKDQLQAANDKDRIKLERDIAIGEQELRRKQLVAELQMHEQQFFLMRFGKELLLFSVGCYWAMRFTARTWGFDDWGITIHDLTSTEAMVSETVLVYWFARSFLSSSG